MNGNALQKRTSGPLKEKGQYVIAFSVLVAMLYVSGIPFFIVLFLGVLSYFIWKMFSAASRIETRKIFEFYLFASEILREDERRWFGFEIKDAIDKGEGIARAMGAATPPLLYFALGALYVRINDYSSAVVHLTKVVEDDNSQEPAIVFPTPDLREYVKLLRKIERDPAEAPKTSAAIRSLERARKNQSAKLLEKCRLELSKPPEALPPVETETKTFKNMINHEKNIEEGFEEEVVANRPKEPKFSKAAFQLIDTSRTERLKKADSSTPFTDRKSISEVLHDIYDKNIQ